MTIRFRYIAQPRGVRKTYCARSRNDVRRLIIFVCMYLLASERSERDTLRSVQSRIVYIYIYIYILWYVQNFVLITRKEGGA